MFISAFLFQNIMLLVKILTTESSKSEADLGIIKGGGGVICAKDTNTLNIPIPPPPFRGNLNEPNSNKSIYYVNMIASVLRFNLNKFYHISYDLPTKAATGNAFTYNDK